MLTCFGIFKEISERSSFRKHVISIFKKKAETAKLREEKYLEEVEDVEFMHFEEQRTTIK